MGKRKELRYKFCPTVPAMYVELYFPKQSGLQAILFKALRDGFDTKKLKRYFDAATARNSGKLQRIEELLREYRPEEPFNDLKANFTKLIESGKGIYYGYTMYEVDGMFCMDTDVPTSGGKHRRKSGNKAVIFEERTQVLRLVFVPPIDELIQTVKNDLKVSIENEKLVGAMVRRMITNYLRHIDGTTKTDFLNEYRLLRNVKDVQGEDRGTKFDRKGPLENISEDTAGIDDDCVRVSATAYPPQADKGATSKGKMKPKISRRFVADGLEMIGESGIDHIIEGLDGWIKNVEFFVLGYLLYEYTSESSIKYVNGELEAENVEHKLWCTSFWNFNVTEIRLENAEDLMVE